MSKRWNFYNIDDPLLNAFLYRYGGPGACEKVSGALHAKIVFKPDYEQSGPEGPWFLKSLPQRTDFTFDRFTSPAVINNEVLPSNVGFFVEKFQILCPSILKDGLFRFRIMDKNYRSTPLWNYALRWKNPVEEKPVFIPDLAFFSASVEFETAIWPPVINAYGGPGELTINLLMPGLTIRPLQ